MANPGPAVEGTTNPAVLTGGVNGAIVGDSLTETVGFYGTTGVAQQTVANTAVAIHGALVNLGLIKAA
jgi:uncharacterized membrane protein YeaQ/YmgE (transglycosylase-associated protein family)